MTPPSRQPGPESLDAWRERLASAGATVRREGRGGLRFAPCPVCGGGSTDSGWIRPGRTGLVGGCNGGCGFEALRDALFPHDSRRVAAPNPFARANTRPATPRRSTSPYGGFSAGATPNGPNSADPPETEAHRATESAERDPPQGRGTPDFARLADLVAERLALGPKARRWIAARGLDAERLAGAGWRSAEAPPEYAKLTGCLTDSGAGEAWPGPVARPWLVLPVWDGDGRPTTLRARPLDGGPALTLRGDVARLYGAEAAGTPPGEALHVAEGETDRESLVAAGALAAVGLPGAAVLHGAAAKLARRIDARRVCVWFDGDPAGERAAERLTARLAAAHIPSRRWRFPPGRDVNDFLRADPAGLRSAVRAMEAGALPA